MEIAFFVRKKATGANTKAANHMPKAGGIEPVSAKLSPIELRMKYNIKISAAITTGAPNPPFLISAPSGAPTKNKITMAKVRANYRWNSIQ